ncbi:molybdate ABC transporter substrate-binding protein [Brevundimonas diminuta]|uniref:molybdate ABC transporter substrate-binding protein n=1 Tax=Brevundimonas diminuta TaxID=293 RepID=UPI0018DF872B|nr:molybdate ABC transporter substrate-binding protein [Brevundimonas diminuta]
MTWADRPFAIGRRGFVGLFLAAALLAGCGSSTGEAETAPVVFAAASLQEAIGDVSEAWVRRGHRAPVVSFAGSSALARQIGAGARADLFISADEAWMDALQDQGRVVVASRAVLTRNRLVLVAPAPAAPLDLRDQGAFDAALGEGRLAIADPEAVPAGRYGKAALTALELWPRVEGRLAPAENVRAALALVERGAAPLGVVYATDARASERATVVAVFPATTHPPIVYPIARLTRSDNREAEAFRRFLLSDEAAAIFRARGFAAGAES